MAGLSSGLPKLCNIGGAWEVFLFVQQKLPLSYLMPMIESENYPHSFFWGTDTDWGYPNLHSAIKLVLIPQQKEAEQMRVSFYSWTSGIAHHMEMGRSPLIWYSTQLFESEPELLPAVLWTPLTSFVFPHQWTSRLRWLLRTSCPSCALSWPLEARTCVVPPSLCSGYSPSTRPTRYGRSFP